MLSINYIRSAIRLGKKLTEDLIKFLDFLTLVKKFTIRSGKK